MTQHAVLRYVEYAGADIAALIAEAMQWLVDRVPFSPEADLTAINQLGTVWSDSQATDETG